MMRLPARLLRPFATIVVALAIVLTFGALAQMVLQRRAPMATEVAFGTTEHVSMTKQVKLAVTPPRSNSAYANTPLEQGAVGTPEIARVGAITLLVPNVDKTVSDVSALTRGERGDVLSLDDKIDAQNGTHPSALLEIRVPESRFENTLRSLGLIGTTQARSITAEDVSSQIVDTSARLRNLRHTERDIQKLMDRSGTVSEVLEAENQLSTVREQIETLDAQVTELRTHVRYSTISVTIEAEAASLVSEPGLAAQLSAAWNKSVHAAGAFTLGIVINAIWLIAFAPYLALAAGAYWIFRTRRIAPKRPSA